MAHQGHSLQDSLQDYKDWQDAKAGHMKYWRAWGSWLSWGSPVGLGLFFIAICFCIWLLAQTFGW